MSEKIPTMKIYKGEQSLIINQSDYENWKKDGWKNVAPTANPVTSSNPVKATAETKSVAKEEPSSEG